MGQAHAWIWQGDGPVALTVIKFASHEPKGTRIATITLGKDETRPLEDVTDIELDAGDRLAFLPAFTGNYQAAHITMSDLKFFMAP